MHFFQGASHVLRYHKGLQNALRAVYPQIDFEMTGMCDWIFCSCLLIFSHTVLHWQKNPEAQLEFFDNLAHDKNFHPLDESQKWGTDVTTRDVISRKVKKYWLKNGSKKLARKIWRLIEKLRNGVLGAWIRCFSHQKKTSYLMQSHNSKLFRYSS